MRLLPLAALLLLGSTLASAVPLPAQDVIYEWTSDESEEQKHLSLESNHDLAEEVGVPDIESDENKTPKKRSPDSIPDVDLCSHHQHAKDSNELKSEDAYERYYHIVKPYDSELRRRRQTLDNNSSSQEDSSEEKGKPGAAGASGGENAKGAVGVRRKRKADDSSSEEDSSEEDSSEEKSKRGADRARRKRKIDDISSEENSSGEKGKPGAVGADGESGAPQGESGVRRKRKVNKNTISMESKEEFNVGVVFDSDSEENGEYNEVVELKKESSLEDYVQGCEVMDADSDEANETTYFEDRRKRSLESKENKELAKFSAINSEQSNEDEQSEKADENHEDGNGSPEVTDALIRMKRRRDANSNKDASKESTENHENGADKSEGCGCSKSKRAADASNESNSNEDSKQSENNSAGCGCSARATNAEEAEKP